jgi:phosphoglycolate phosphatase-like HAD superfamily hydrolase
LELVGDILTIYNTVGFNFIPDIILRITISNSHFNSEFYMKIFLDIDGVLADFNGRYRRLYGVYPAEKFNKTLWTDFVKTAQFANLDLLPGASDLVKHLEELQNTIKGVSVVILGSTGGYDFHGEVQRQKLFWLKTNSIKFNPIFVPGKRYKKYFASSSSLLVDDTEKNIQEFIQNEGKAHLYKHHQDAILAVNNFVSRGNDATT